MNCLQDNNIQAYIDRELSSNEMEAMDKHLEECSFCKEKVEKRKLLVTQLIGDWNLPEVEFSIPEFRPKKQVVLKSTFKRKSLYWVGAAAMLIFFLFVYSPEQESIHPEQTETLFLEMDFEIDANKPWAEQEMTIVFSEQLIENEYLN